MIWLKDTKALNSGSALSGAVILLGCSPPDPPKRPMETEVIWLVVAVSGVPAFQPFFRISFHGVIAQSSFFTLRSFSV